MATFFYSAWLIYGNTFHYSEEALACRDLSAQNASLWNLEMVLIAFGYLQLFFVCLLSCCLGCYLCIMCGKIGLAPSEEQSEA
jgi:hypothetical protein